MRQSISIVPKRPSSQTSSDEFDRNTQELVVDHVGLHCSEHANAPEEHLDHPGGPFRVLEGSYTLVFSFCAEQLGQRLDGLVIDGCELCTCLGTTRRIQPKLHVQQGRVRGVPTLFLDQGDEIGQAIHRGDDRALQGRAELGHFAVRSSP